MVTDRKVVATTSVDDGIARFRSQRMVSGVFTHRSAAEAAVREIRDAGFAAEEIGVAFRGSDVPPALAEHEPEKEAINSLVGGGVFGGVAGLILGLGAVIIPGVGPVIAGGALATALGVAGGSALAGAGVGATAAGIMYGLASLGVSEDMARRFESQLRSGATLVMVSAGGRADQARKILEAHGAESGFVHSSDTA